ncbi:hypothetical protein O3P69_014353 [Scylla paramamosain]|uniref:Uncharacterized protein n=2 Tax=Scylla paramamosain TaxID=85552 RepID=A0AAW0TAR0_SCYPA
MDYDQEVDLEQDTLVATHDSLDIRIIDAFANHLNFTPEIHAEPKRSFGDERDGQFTGMIGQLQREESDFSTIVAPTPGRLKAIDYLR